MTAFVSGAIFIAGCQKDTSLDNSSLSSSDSGTISDRAYSSLLARAGADQNITSSTVSLDGSASSGSITSYAWTKEVGNGGTITSPSQAKTTVTGLSNGDYRFRLVIKDSRGNSASDTIHVKVSGVSGGGTTPPPSGSNQNPTVSAGAAQTIALPISTVTLTGTASDPDGTIATYAWTKVSGSGGIIATPTQRVTAVTGLTAGSYTFNLKVTDNQGASANSNVNITVNPAPSTGGGGSTTPPSGYTLAYSTGYNVLSDIINSHGQEGNGGLSTSVYKDGPGSFKSVPANVSAGIRSEVQYDALQTPDEGIVEYDVMYEVVPQNNCHSLQWHPNTSGGSASPGLWHVNGKFDLVNWKGGTNVHHATGVTIQTNHWYHLRFEYKFGSSGYMRFYSDGVLSSAGSWTGQVGDGSGQYLKVGVNMWQSQTSVVYYDNLKIYKKS